MKVIAIFGIFAFLSQLSSAHPVESHADNSILVKLNRTSLNHRSFSSPLLEEYIQQTDDSVHAVDQEIYLRVRRQANDPRFQGNLNVDHSRQSGTNVYAEGQARLWRSENARNDIHANGHYGQHFGGPGGRSPPNYGAGLMFTHRF